MDKREMIKAMIDGKTLIYGGAIAYYDESKQNPFRYKFLNDPEEALVNLNLGWQIKSKPMQITDRFEFMKQVMNRRDRGEQFFIRYKNSRWFIPESFGFGTNDISYYEWTAIDEDGNPIGEPQKFVKKSDK